MAKKVDTKELGLVLGAQLMKTDDLHYGLWKEGMEVKITNLKTAQMAYIDFLLENFPPNVKTILDVGCGTGHLSSILRGKGYQVEAVSPSAGLTEMARKRLGDDFVIHQCFFEDLKTENKYDLVIFSESFQYIDPAFSLPRALELLNPGGHVLICDFFQTDAPGKPPIRGGHKLSYFRPILEAQPYEVLKEIDITKETAPNMDLMEELLEDYAHPLWEAGRRIMKGNYPITAKILGFFLRKRLAKIEASFLSKKSTAAAFLEHQRYLLMLLKPTK